MKDFGASAAALGSGQTMLGFPSWRGLFPAFPRVLHSYIVHENNVFVEALLVTLMSQQALSHRARVRCFKHEHNKGACRQLRARQASSRSEVNKQTASVVSASWAPERLTEAPVSKKKGKERHCASARHACNVGGAEGIIFPLAALALRCKPELPYPLGTLNPTFQIVRAANNGLNIDSNSQYRELFLSEGWAAAQYYGCRVQTGRKHLLPSFS